ncbi:GNAT family N-acetyltransferase [Actinomyces bowdenii]|nr:GNAT family N-acetyltransferase [Actinomyces bowdenii]
MRVGEVESLSIRTMRAPDAGPVTRVWHASWMDTYVRPGGISAQDAQARWARRLSAEGIARLAGQIEEARASTGLIHLVAERGQEMVGLAIAEQPPAGEQHLRVMYVTAQSRSQGVGAALMRAVLEWADATRPIELGVAAFNTAAQRFYARHGFVLVPGSRRLHDGIIPEVTMRRAPGGAPGRDGA